MGFLSESALQRIHWYTAAIQHVSSLFAPLQPACAVINTFKVNDDITELCQPTRQRFAYELTVGHSQPSQDIYWQSRNSNDFIPGNLGSRYRRLGNNEWTTFIGEGASDLCLIPAYTVWRVTYRMFHLSFRGDDHLVREQFFF